MSSLDPKHDASENTISTGKKLEIEQRLRRHYNSTSLKLVILNIRVILGDCETTERKSHINDAIQISLSESRHYWLLNLSQSFLIAAHPCHRKSHDTLRRCH